VIEQEPSPSQVEEGADANPAMDDDESNDEGNSDSSSSSKPPDPLVEQLHELLLKTDYDEKNVDELLDTVSSDHTDHRSNYLSWTALQIAADRGHLRAVERLIQRRADVLASDALQRNPLHLAASSGHATVVEQLLGKDGIDINKSSGYYEWTALHFAVGSSDVATVRALLKRGASVLATDNDGWTPLMLSVLDHGGGYHRYPA
jgi:ankyrin repeat protein